MTAKCSVIGALFSAVAASCSAYFAWSAFLKEWAVGSPSVRVPTCYWLGYKKDEDGNHRMYLALPIHVFNEKGLSAVLYDLIIR